MNGPNPTFQAIKCALGSQCHSTPKKKGERDRGAKGRGREQLTLALICCSRDWNSVHRLSVRGVGNALSSPRGVSPVGAVRLSHAPLFFRFTSLFGAASLRISVCAVCGRVVETLVTSPAGELRSETRTHTRTAGRPGRQAGRRADKGGCARKGSGSVSASESGKETCRHTSWAL